MKKLSSTSQPRFLESEITGNGSTYKELSDLQCKCNGEMGILKDDLAITNIE